MVQVASKQKKKDRNKKTAQRAKYFAVGRAGDGKAVRVVS